MMGIAGLTMPVLDVLQTYLLVLNLSSLLVNAVHVALVRRAGRQGVHPMALCVLSLAGGAPVALLVQLVGDFKTTKQNALEHVVTTTSAVIWGVVLAFVYMLPVDIQRIVTSLRSPNRWLLAYLGVMSLVCLVAFGIDKRRAIKNGQRVPEAVLLLLAGMGGTLGGLLGMLLFRHKIRSPQFSFGMPLILVAQLCVLALVVSLGLL